MTPALFITRCLIGIGVSFLGMAAICVLLYPQVFHDYQYGISYFGSVPRTAVPYYLGFALTISLIILLSKKLRTHNKPLSVIFGILALCMSGVALTSFSLNHSIYAAHWTFAITLIVWLVAAIIWLLLRGGLLPLDYLLAGVVMVTAVVSSLEVIHHIPIAKVYILRELIVFAGSLWLFGRAALRSAAT